jgi:protein involved in polysaccharide export with SLBB domain
MITLLNEATQGRKRFLPTATEFAFLAVAFVTLLAGSRLWAQNAPDAPPTNHESALAQDNLRLVAASESEIAGVLRQNPGLLVELKRWMAKDAADRGQILEDSDLEDSAVLTRLAQDQKFRAAATRLLQSYGYLLPKVNLDSELGREQTALEQEHIRQVVADEAARHAEQVNAGRAACHSESATNAPECQKQNGQITTTGAPPSGGGVPPAEPRDRDTNQMLINPVPGSGSGSASLLSTALDSTQGEGTAGTNLAPGLTPDSSLLATLNSASATADLESSQPSPEPSTPPAASGGTKGPSNRVSPATEKQAETEPPAAEVQWSPYSNIPSIYDMYANAGAATGSVERFGVAIFRNAPPSAGTIPIDFPASPDYVLGPGDSLTIDIWGGVSQRLYRTVDHEGRIELPELGPLEVNGQTLANVQQAVQSELRTQFRDASADVSLSRVRAVRVYVVGEVNRPGPYDVSSLSTPLNALLAAGGPSTKGSMRIIEHYRGDALIQRVDLYDLLLRGVRTDVKRLEPGDTLLVPPMREQIQIDGMVRRPAIYEMNGETNLAQVLDLAGGILPTAALSHIEVQRLEAHEKRTMLSLDVSGATDPSEIRAKLAAFQVQDRDEIHVFPIATFNQDAVYLEGHVLRAGRYSYKPGMKLTDLISSYQDLLPEPATQYAEIIRLNSPDYRPSVESFNLGAALQNPQAAPTLQPLDTVRIFSQFDFENPPTVSVSGAVRNPGTYQTSGQIHLRDAIQLAGGITPDADTESAQIIRMLADSSLKILSVRLKAVLDGDTADNLLLESRDRILVKENISRADPASVRIGGEVVNPGRYPLTVNLRVSDLVRLAGGLKRSAEADTADLMDFITSDNAPLVAKHISVNLTAAMAGDPEQDLTLRDGDVLNILEVPGWNDLQASITIGGEVKHPGRYGIRPGERLSSVLQRAGGFLPDAYPYGAVFERGQVRDLETKEQGDMIVRVREVQQNLAMQPDSDPKQKIARDMAIAQWQSSLDQLDANPPVGRVALRVSSDIQRWENTPADIEVHSGDTFFVPKKPGYVMVTGQVFNPTALTYRSGRSANWYLGQAGGPTPLAYKKGIFVIRADGSVVGARKGLWTGDSLSAALQPGDTVVVPEKALSGNVQWQNVLLSAQVAASIASTVYIAIRY